MLSEASHRCTAEHLASGQASLASLGDNRCLRLNDGVKHGHSGSTLLEYLLAASPKVVACGEVASVLRERGRKGKCTCGREVRLCPVWGPLLASTETLDGMTGPRLAGTGWRCIRRAGRFLKDRLALGRRPLSSRPGAWASLQARASGARSARGLLVGGEEVGTSRRAPAHAAPLGIGGTRLVGREPRLRTVRPRLSGPLSALRYEDLARSPAETTRRLLAEILPGSEWRADAIGASGNPPPALRQPHVVGAPVACRGEGGCRLDARHAGRLPRAPLGTHRSALPALLESLECAGCCGVGRWRNP
jgi:hypothetical protein